MSVFLHEFTDCDYFMSLDSDIEVGNVFPSNNIFNKLVEHDLDFVGGLYAIKKPGTIKCSSIAMDGESPDFNSGVTPMRWLSSGCWCLKRSVAEKMVETYPELTYDGDDNAAGKKIHGLYMPYIYDFKENEFENVKLPFRKLLSEDWAFCQRWRDIGGKIFADTSIVLKHIGKVDYSLYNVEMIQKPMPPTPGFDLENNWRERKDD